MHSHQGGYIAIAFTAASLFYNIGSWDKIGYHETTVFTLLNFF